MEQRLNVRSSGIIGNSDGSVTVTGPLNISTGVTSGTAIFNSSNMYHYSSPIEMDRIFTDRGVEIVYKQTKTSLINYGWFNTPPDEIVVYKEVHTFGPEGHEVTRVDGKYIPSRDETYEFED